MSFGMGKVRDVRGGSEMFLEPFPRGSCRFTNVLLIMLYYITLVNCSIFQCYGGNQEVLDGVSSLEVNFIPSLFQMLSLNPLVLHTTMWMLLSMFACWLLLWLSVLYLWLFLIFNQLNAN